MRASPVPPPRNERIFNGFLQIAEKDESNQLAEQLRKAKQQKESLQKREDNDLIETTGELLDTISAGPEMLDSFDEELFRELIDTITVESNTKIRFRLTNGLELPESIERMVR